MHVCCAVCSANRVQCTVHYACALCTCALYTCALCTMHVLRACACACAFAFAYSPSHCREMACSDARHTQAHADTRRRMQTHAGACRRMIPPAVILPARDRAAATWLPDLGQGTPYDAQCSANEALTCIEIVYRYHRVAESRFEESRDIFPIQASTKS